MAFLGRKSVGIWVSLCWASDVGLNGCILGETRYEEEEAVYGRDHEDRGQCY